MGAKLTGVSQRLQSGDHVSVVPACAPERKGVDIMLIRKVEARIEGEFQRLGLVTAERAQLYQALAILQLAKAIDRLSMTIIDKNGE